MTDPHEKVKLANNTSHQAAVELETVHENWDKFRDKTRKHIVGVAARDILDADATRGEGLREGGWYE